MEVNPMKTKVGLAHEPQRGKPWVVYWWTPPDFETGKQSKRKKAFKYKREAQGFQADRQSALNRGDLEQVRRGIALGDFLDEFEKARVATLSHSSQTCYANTMTQLREHFGSPRPLATIRQQDAERFVATRTRRNGSPAKLGGHAIAQHVKLCRAIFGAAVEYGYIDRNPFVPGAKQTGSPLFVKKPSSAWHHITPGEFAAFIAEVPDARRRTIFWLMYGCGLRPGEAYNLTLDRIDIEDRRVYVESRSATPDVPPFTIKAEAMASGDKSRYAPIPEAAIPDIVEACKGALKAGGFVALSPDRFEHVQTEWRACREGKPWGGRTEHRPWQNRDMVNNLLRSAKAYMRRAKVKLSAPLKLTTFRKSFGQNHADNGTPPRTLAKLMGHSDASVTMEFYNRVTDANERAAASTMDRILGAANQAKAVSDAG
jgi:integrase